MKQIGILIILALIITACQNDNKEQVVIPEDKDLVFKNLYNDEKLLSEFFEINPQRDTILLTKNGTTLILYANSFTRKDSIEVIDSLRIEVKEAYNPIDFVLGNLTTTSNNQLLESGGMIYINAFSGSNELLLKDDSEIGVFVPTTDLDEQMMIYSGQRDSSNLINWDSPEHILNSKLRTLEQSYITITYQFFNEFNDNDEKFNDWLWKPNRKVGDKITIDGEVVTIIDIAKNLIALRESENGLFIPDVITKKGQNGFVEDYNTSYIFSIKKLGWANIDKLFFDPKSQEIEMLATIDNEKEFSYVFTSLLLPEKNMYIPGYQKQDNSFGFSHNDNEILVLPIGSRAIILATAYKEDKPYFSIKEFTITTNQSITFALKETTPENLKKTLGEQI